MNYQTLFNKLADLGYLETESDMIEIINIAKELGTKPTRGVKQGSIRAPYATKKTETVTINFRVPKVAKEAAKDFVRPLLKEFILTLNK